MFNVHINSKIFPAWTAALDPWIKVATAPQWYSFTNLGQKPNIRHGNKSSKEVYAGIDRLFFLLFIL